MANRALVFCCAFLLVFFSAASAQSELLQRGVSFTSIVPINEGVGSFASSTLTWLRSSDNSSFAVLEAIPRQRSCQVKVVDENSLVRWTSPCGFAPTTARSYDCSVRIDPDGDFKFRFMNSVVWSTDSAGKDVNTMILSNGVGELTLLDSSNRTVWTSGSVPSSGACFAPSPSPSDSPRPGTVSPSEGLSPSPSLSEGLSPSPSPSAGVTVFPSVHVLAGLMLAWILSI